MKTSNKLLTLIVSLIFIIATAGMIDIRLFGRHRGEDNPLKKTINVPIGEYKYLVLENVKYLEIKPSQQNHFNFILYNDTTNWGMTYEITNDTLKIIGEDSNNQSRSYWLYSNSIIENIIANNTNLELSGLNLDALNIEVKNGNVNNYRNALIVKKLNISQQNSRVHLQHAKVDTLSIEMEDSYTRFDENLATISAKLHKESELSLRNLSDIQLQKDESSKLSIY